MDSVAQIECRWEFPFPRTDLSCGLCNGCAERGVAVQDDNTDLQFKSATCLVTRREALAQQLHAMHPGLDAASAVVSGQSSPQRTAQISRRAHRFVAGDCSSGCRLPGFCVLARWNDGTGVTGSNRLVAFAGVTGPVSGDADDFLNGRDWSRSSGSMGASPTLLPVTSTARTSSVSSSIPMCILRQMRRLGPPTACARSTRLRPRL